MVCPRAAERMLNPRGAARNGDAFEHRPGTLPRYRSAFACPRGTNLWSSWPVDFHAENWPRGSPLAGKMLLGFPASLPPRLMIFLRQPAARRRLSRHSCGELFCIKLQFGNALDAFFSSQGGYSPSNRTLNCK